MKLFVFAVYSQVIYSRSHLFDTLAQQRSVSNFCRLSRPAVRFCWGRCKENHAVFLVSDPRRTYVYNSHSVLCFILHI